MVVAITGATSALVAPSLDLGLEVVEQRRLLGLATESEILDPVGEAAGRLRLFYITADVPGDSAQGAVVIREVLVPHKLILESSDVA